GEVVGLTGLVGSGFDEIPYLVYGALPARGGRLALGRVFDLADMSPARAIAAGIALVPGDRARDGGVASLSVGANVTLPVLGRYASRHGLDRREMDRDAAALLARHHVRALSGHRVLVRGDVTFWSVLAGAELGPALVGGRIRGAACAAPCTFW